MLYLHIFLLTLLISGCSDDKQNNNPPVAKQEQSAEIPNKPKTVIISEEAPITTGQLQKTYTLSQDETLTHVLKSAGFSLANIINLAKSVKPHFDFTKIRINTQFDVIETKESKTIRFANDYAKVIEATLVNNKWQIAEVETPLFTHEVSRSFSIDHSLYQAANKANVPQNVVNSAIIAMSHFIDFQREIRQGDEITLNFTVSKVKHDTHLFNQFSPPQMLVAIDFKNQGKQYSLYQYQNAFYFEDGKLAQNFLMKTPLNGARLSSYFGKRKHPVLGYTRQHKGIDFSAPIGTPIMAAGKGKVIKASYSKSFGNRVLIDHSNGYRSLYAHLKGFAKGIKQGSLVRQGQIIGYLGNTGLSTARHLHYELHKNGRVINPLKMKQPSNIQLSGDDLLAFNAHIKTINKRYTALVVKQHVLDITTIL
ncbi:M23 family metallopeptidase [Pseudoalteromonas sp.]|uniref:M23 family metallopeptidase n=1 Tax=Pseudoalteromonas sp. TaxID=53249 RepID=UPI003564D346